MKLKTPEIEELFKDYPLYSQEHEKDAYTGDFDHPNR